MTKSNKHKEQHNHSKDSTKQDVDKYIANRVESAFERKVLLVSQKNRGLIPQDATEPLESDIKLHTVPDDLEGFIPRYVPTIDVDTAAAWAQHRAIMKYNETPEGIYIDLRFKESVGVNVDRDEDTRLVDLLIEENDTPEPKPKSVGEMIADLEAKHKHFAHSPRIDKLILQKEYDHFNLPGTNITFEQYCAKFGGSKHKSLATQFRERQAKLASDTGAAE